MLNTKRFKTPIGQLEYIDEWVVLGSYDTVKTLDLLLKEREQNKSSFDKYYSTIMLAVLLTEYHE